MCLPQEKSDGSKGKVPSSPWRRIIKQHLKPKLSRSVVACAKINLNRYWSKFEKLSAGKCSLMTFQSDSDLKVERLTTSILPSRSPSASSQVDDNEINDNIFNEIVEIDF